MGLAALIAAVTALAFWLDHRFSVLSKVGASLLVILFGAVLSNLGVVPHTSPVYRAVEGPVTSLAIVYLLLSVSLADLREAGPRVLVVFLVASLGTSIGALLGAVTFAGALGPDTWKLAGAFTGTYTGGSLNFAAVGRGLGLPASTFAAAAAADNVTTTLWLGVTLALPVWLMRRTSGSVEAGPRPADAPGANPPGAAPRPGDAAAADPDGETTASDTDDAHPFWSRSPVSLLDLTSLAALGVGVLLMAHILGRWIGGVPEILWVTTLALALAQLPAVQALEGAGHLGNLGLHFFFVVIGIRSVVAEILKVGPEVFYYTVLVVAVHGIILYILGRAVRGTIPMIAVASQAAIGGPSTAMALTVSRDWPGLMLPGVAVGLFGYALGNYAGFGVAYLTRLIVGG